MTLLWIALLISLLAGLLAPFGARLQATGLWAGKALLSPNLASAFPRGLQDELTDGWPSWVGFLTSPLLPFIAAVVGFFYAWWAAPAAFLFAILVYAIADRTPIAPRPVERYLVLLLEHANRRRADYLKQGDTERAEAAAELSQKLIHLLEPYLGSGVPAPNMRLARAAPFGNTHFLLEQFPPDQP